MNGDPSEEVREELHDAVDAAVDAATRDKAIDDRFAALDERISQVLSNPVSPTIDYDRIQAMIDAKMAAPVVVSAETEAETETDSDGDSDSDDGADDVEDAAEAVEDAIDDASTLDEKIAAQAELNIKPEIPERPPIKVHPLFRRIFGGK